jgi:hypothetical protein
VAIGGLDAICALQRARNLLLDGAVVEKYRVDWINEALEQLH